MSDEFSREGCDERHRSVEKAISQLHEGHRDLWKALGAHETRLSRIEGKVMAWAGLGAIVGGAAVQVLMKFLR